MASRPQLSVRSMTCCCRQVRWSLHRHLWSRWSQRRCSPSWPQITHRSSAVRCRAWASCASCARRTPTTPSWNVAWRDSRCRPTRPCSCWVCSHARRHSASPRMCRRTSPASYPSSGTRSARTTTSARRASPPCRHSCVSAPWTLRAYLPLQRRPSRPSPTIQMPWTWTKTMISPRTTTSSSWMTYRTTMTCRGVSDARHAASWAHCTSTAPWMHRTHRASLHRSQTA